MFSGMPPAACCARGCQSPKPLLPFESSPEPPADASIHEACIVLSSTAQKSRMC
jgi:hypothetical protein